MNHRVTKQNFSEWNEAMFSKYSPAAFHEKSHPAIRWIESLRVKKIIQFLDVNPQDKILEVGCGSGNILEKISCGELVGVDLADAAIRESQERLGSRATIRKADAEQLPFADESFPKVYCSEVLEHVLDPAQVLREILRVLAPGGIAVVSVPNEKLIDGIKSVLMKLNLFSLFQKNEDYTVSEDMTDEWHLHELDLAHLKKLLPPRFQVDRAAKIPSALMPMRFVLKLTKAAG